MMLKLITSLVSCVNTKPTDSPAPVIIVGRHDQLKMLTSRVYPNEVKSYLHKSHSQATLRIRFFVVRTNLVCITIKDLVTSIAVIIGM